MSETVQEENINPAEPPPQKSKKTLIIIILALIIVIGGGGGGFYFWSSSTASAAEDKSNSEDGKKKKERKKPDLELDDELEDEAEEEPEEAEEAGEKKVKKSSKNSVKDALQNSLPDDEDVKHIIELQPFIINLADETETRYLRMTVNLGVGESDGEEPSKLFLTRVKNAMLAVISVKTSEDVLSVKGKNKLRKELLKAAQLASEEPKVEAIYITDFIVQL